MVKRVNVITLIYYYSICQSNQGFYWVGFGEVVGSTDFILHSALLPYSCGQAFGIDGNVLWLGSPPMIGAIITARLVIAHREQPGERVGVVQRFFPLE
jgi:hypothetical protein